MLSSCRQIAFVTVVVLTQLLNVIFILDHSKIMRNCRTEDKLPHQEKDENAHIRFDKGTKDYFQCKPELKIATNRKVKIEAKSSNEDVYVSMDGVKVYHNNVKGGGSRGIHVVVLNQHTGTKMASRIFDTCLYEREDEEMILFLNLLQEGRIVVFMIKDDGSGHLKKSVRNRMKQFGSLLINYVAWRDMWVFISKIRNKWLAEAHEKSSLDRHGSPIVAQAEIQLEDTDKSCKWDSDIGKRREKFCAKYEGYGSVCSCTTPALIDLNGPPLLNNHIAAIPIAVIAANRPHYLYRMLRGLLVTPGVDKNMVTVYIDGFFDEPAAVAELFGVKYEEHMPICLENCRISQHYKRSLSKTFQIHPHSKYMIVLEEDLDVSKDIMDYFGQLIPVYESDPSVYCISAWNDQGYEYSSSDPAMLYRVETMPGLGWVLKKSIFVNELERKWPGPDKLYEWDLWMRSDSIRKGRECIIPDVSRTYHFGTKGFNINPFFLNLYFAKKALNTHTGIQFDTSKVTKDGYEKYIHQAINKSQILDHTINPCAEDFVPNTRNLKYVFYIKYEHKTDYGTWYNVAKCFKLWDVDVRGIHKGMWRFWIKGNIIFVVGSISPYYVHKATNLLPIFMPKKENGK